jgi:hypothetical protein
MYNANESLDDIYILIKNIKDSSDKKEKECKIKQFEEHLKKDNTMLNEYPNPNIKFEFVDMLYGFIKHFYTRDNTNTNHEDKRKLDDIVTRIFPDEEMRDGKKPRKTKKSRKTKKARKTKKTMKTMKSRKTRKTRKTMKTRKTKKRTKRGGVDEPDAPFLTLSMLNTSNDSAIGESAIGESAIGESAIGESAIGESTIGKTDIEESGANDELFGDLSMISVNEQDGPNELDITNTTMDPLTLSMLNTSNDSAIGKTDIEESFGGKRKRRTKRRGKK